MKFFSKLFLLLIFTNHLSAQIDPKIYWQIIKNAESELEFDARFYENSRDSTLIDISELYQVFEDRNNKNDTMFWEINNGLKTKMYLKFDNKLKLVNSCVYSEEGKVLQEKS